MDNANVSRPIQKYRERRVQDLVDLKFHYLTLLSRCAHAMSNLCRPWMMLVAIGDVASLKRR